MSRLTDGQKLIRGSEAAIQRAISEIQTGGRFDLRESLETLLSNALPVFRRIKGGPSERDIELRVLGRLSQSGHGTGSDTCEAVWKVLKVNGIHADGKTSLPEFVQQLCTARRE